MKKIAGAIADSNTIQLLARERAECINGGMVRPRGATALFSIDGYAKTVESSLLEKAKEALKLIEKYSPGGSGEVLLETLRTLRNQRFAHFDIKATSELSKNAPAADVAGFYGDNPMLIHLVF